MDLGPLLLRAAAELQQRAETAGVVLRITPSETPVAVGHPYLFDVMTHLIDNAIRVSPPGGTVAVDAQAIGDDVLIWVRDEGSGIPAENVEAQRIIEANGGALWPECMPPLGCTYVVRLPNTR
ncbi:MAG: HAMP domain-containing sensor histidine kinase [Longimicrobiales bacterium]